MARNEDDKEDLMREASALIERIEISMEINAAGMIVTAGYRRDASLSLYFNQDAFYQFTETGLLRRAWKDGLLYRSQGDTLAALFRNRSSGQVIMERTDLNPVQLAEFRAEMTRNIEELTQNLQSNSVIVRRVAGPDGDLLTKIELSLAEILACGESFLSPTIVVGR